VTEELHRIVVVGGGAGGLELATRLGDKLGRRGKAHVTLIDRSRTHLWKPLLHEVAAGSMDPDTNDLDYLAQAHWHHFTFRLGGLIGIELPAWMQWIAFAVLSVGAMLAFRTQLYDRGRHRRHAESGTDANRRVLIPQTLAPGKSLRTE